MQSDKRIDKYQFNLRRLLGQGSYASVYFGKVINSSQEVAVKVIDKRIFTSSYNLRSIQSEIDIMKKMRHASIVQLHDVYQTANNMYIITELCDYDLLQELKKERRLDEQMAVAYLKDIVCGVKYLHTMGIIHRDLKPANILIKDGHCKIADFGFAKTLNDSDSMMRSVVGTPLYMSPQLLKRTHYTNKSDIWSIGLIYYEMLHGRTPWVAQNEAQLLQAIHHSRINYSKNISDLSRDFITRCLQLSEQDRMSWEQAFSHPLIHVPSSVSASCHASPIAVSPTMAISPPQSHQNNHQKATLLQKVKQNLNKTQHICFAREIANQESVSSNKENVAQRINQGEKENTRSKDGGINCTIGRNFTPKRSTTDLRLKTVEALTPKRNANRSHRLKQVIAFTSDRPPSLKSHTPKAQQQNMRRKRNITIQIQLQDCDDKECNVQERRK